MCMTEVKQITVYAEVAGKQSSFMIYNLIRQDQLDEIKRVFLAHLSQRLIGKLIVYPWSGVRRRRLSVPRPSVVHNAQTSSSQKPLGRSKPNFMWSLLG